PARRNRAVCVSIEPFGPWQRMRDARAGFTAEACNGGGDDASLLHGFVRDRHDAVRHGAFKTLERPRGPSLLTNESPVRIEEARVERDRLAWIEIQFGGGDLQMRRRAGRGWRRLVKRESGRRCRAPWPDRVDRVTRHEEDAAA